MPKFQNIHPGGDLELPLVGRIIRGGDTVEVSDEQAKLLAAQPDVWKPVDDKKETGK